MALEVENIHSEAIHWPDSMWPDFIGLLTYYPPELLPTVSELQALRYPWELKRLLLEKLNERVTEQRIDTTVELAANTDIIGPVWLADGVRVLPQAVIVGPTYIGPHTVIGNHVLVREASLNGGCVIGDDSEVARSILGRSSTMHRAVAVDSLIGNNVALGGSRAVNVRIDRQNVRSTVKGQRLDTGEKRLGAMIGSGAFLGNLSVVNPGVKIGANCQVGPGVILTRDLPDNTRILLKQEYDISTII